MKVTTLGIDVAKSIFRVHGVDVRGAAVLRRQLTRKQLLLFLARLEPCLAGMEACAGAHYWAREIEKLGHTAKPMSPHFVTPYRKSQKNDGNDAEAICEAVGRPFDALHPDQARTTAGHPSARSHSLSAHQVAYGASERNPRPAGRVRNRGGQRYRALAPRAATDPR